MNGLITKGIGGFYYVKTEQDAPTIGLLLCKSKNNLVAEYSLRDITKPIGVSEYRITSSLPESLQSHLPSVEDLRTRIGNGTLERTEG